MKHKTIPYAMHAFLFVILFTPCWASRQSGAVPPADCLDCHADSELTGETPAGLEVSVFVDEARYAASVHGDTDCTDCHADAGDLPHDDALQPVDCAQCHADVMDDYGRSIHAKAAREGSTDAPTCGDCHGKHDIFPSSDPRARTYPLNVAAACATCHSDPNIVAKYNIPVHDPLSAYRSSVHGLAVLSEKNFDAATCISCHGNHVILPMSDPASPIYWANVSHTCEQCHVEIAAQYDESVHGAAVAEGVRDAPVCTDCHGEHSVKRHDDPSSPVHPLRVASATCERCHASEMLSDKYGIASARVSTYEDSYHGLANKGGSLSAANCASCHGIHNIFASSDPRSTINPRNLQETCGKCHADATENFAKGSIHLTRSTTPGRVVALVQRLYIWLIVVVIGGMVLHNGADFTRRSRRRLAARRSVSPGEDGARAAVNFARWPLNERIQHWAMAVSFFVLVTTGFALKYPESWWTHPMTQLPWLFELRGIAHRVAGTLMLALGAYHVAYMLATRRGRRLVREFSVGVADVRHFAHNIRYILGVRRSPAAFGHFNYMEKAEYYALIWGTVVMGLTGLAVWFKGTTLDFFPKWTINLATVVHLYEAWLATLAIIVWHLYFAIFNPDVYPLNTAMIDGTISEEEMREDHAGEWRALHGDASSGEGGDGDAGDSDAGGPETKPDDDDNSTRETGGTTRPRTPAV